jgi:hypothetical protein
MNKILNSLAKDLTKECPRSPHEILGGYVIAARMLDKCRALVNDTNGEYHFDCPLDGFFLNFAGIGSLPFKQFIESGANDEEVAAWITEQSQHSEDTIKLWNLKMRQTRITDLPVQLQLFLEGYIRESIPKNRRVYTWFDVYDIEEGII